MDDHIPVRELAGVHHGDELVAHVLVLSGRLTGNVCVLQGGILRLGGHLDGDLCIDAGGNARIDGTVNGNITNAGGQLAICATSLAPCTLSPAPRTSIQRLVGGDAGVAEFDGMAVPLPSLEDGPPHLPL